MSEVDYKVKFAKQYFGKGCCEFAAAIGCCYASGAAFRRRKAR